ncbi:MAG TPA: sigma 54-interacting transcriptional regulator [Lentibacillus sp.]|uniref:sigma-54 interaction domain-containing protein n=1 Tax=Lentibacillus sp. TaxID=1925746 RepID=UPI002B4B2DF3|nr:sigma 54-interacting transcriptional regulator [Lentibacillus sp.]HLR62395.1 sigma 54-interacting transcriptional regulator [Lentibacillus sp.]
MNQTDNENKIEITPVLLKDLLDYSSDEIFIFNNKRQIIYVNSICERNYGLKKEDLLGKESTHLFEKAYWTPSIYPEVYKKKKPISIIQTTNTGAELFTSAIPVLNDRNEIELVITTARALDNFKTHTYNELVKIESQEAHGMITHSDKIKHIIKFAGKVGKTNSTILIQGESGTGKGILAQYIHQASSRKDQSFLTINCAAIPEELLESELFGYTKGAFTGANPSGKSGLLETADNGTIFLDEIGDISMVLQAKLLQVIQDKEFIPVGGHKKKKVNIRFIAATNRDLAQLIEEEKFREDLYYRLNVIDLTLPPLRERKEDIIPLIYYFLNKFNQEYETNKVISQKCLGVLTEYSWPGNIRQLENLMERLVIISDNVIEYHDLPETFFQKKQHADTDPDTPLTMDEAVEQAKQYMIRKSYQQHKSSRKVAEDLQVSQTTATRLIRKYCSDLQKDL